MMLVVSEASEAIEAARKKNYAKKDIAEAVLALHGDIEYSKEFEKHIKDTFEDEIADTIIRLLDMAEYHEIDINFHVLAKMKYNKTRPHKHGKEF